MRTVAVIKALGDFLYKNTVMLILGSLYVGIYAANIEALDI